MLSISVRSSPYSVLASKFRANIPNALDGSISIRSWSSSPRPTTEASWPFRMTIRIRTFGVGAVFVTIFVPVGRKGTLQEGQETNEIERQSQRQDIGLVPTASHPATRHREYIASCNVLNWLHDRTHIISLSTATLQILQLIPHGNHYFSPCKLFHATHKTNTWQDQEHLNYGIIGDSPIWENGRTYWPSMSWSMVASVILMALNLF